MSSRVLILQPDSEISKKISSELELKGFFVQECRLAIRAFEMIAQDTPDIVVMDLDLSDMSGIAFLTALRETEKGRALPVIVMGDSKDEDVIAQAFTLRADDYMQKPIVTRELFVRIHAVLRRHFDRVEQLGGPIRLNGISLDPGRRLCKARRKLIDLRPREFELLEILMRKAGRVLSRSYLLETIWGMSRDAQTRAVDIAISRLRRRLGDPSSRAIETVEKLGYRFRDPNIRI